MHKKLHINYIQSVFRDAFLFTYLIYLFSTIYQKYIHKFNKIVNIAILLILLWEYHLF